MIPRVNVVRQFKQQEMRKMLEDSTVMNMDMTSAMRLDMEVGQAIRYFYTLKVMDVLDYSTLGETEARDKMTVIIRVVGAKKQFATSNNYEVLARDLISIIQHYAEKYDLIKKDEEETAVPF